MTTINTLDTLPNGIIQIRLQKSDGGWHRVSIEPGMDVDFVLAQVNAHLKHLDCACVSTESNTALKQEIQKVHTPEVIQSFQLAKEKNERI